MGMKFGCQVGYKHFILDQYFQTSHAIGLQNTIIFISTKFELI
jgi:hypothetical protein